MREKFETRVGGDSRMRENLMKEKKCWVKRERQRRRERKIDHGFGVEWWDEREGV